ncbi:sterol desaturase family protein [Shimia sp. R9_3]|uniref:sterol desaturase family protein n=1 Tax=Shimia sp. R9_3 TaxID=2821113 RepID=UPI001ADB71D7|nr:sterol desaturase family protein [Shimia sp. R9_3]MBO9403154.1 sterol desaturase family protein [Shimia sp. R9_3]
MDITELAQLALSKITGITHNANLRHFWVYVLCGMAIAVCAHRVGGDDRKFHSVFFKKEVWGSRSAFIDYIILIANPIIMVLAFDWLLKKLWSLSAIVASGVKSFGADLQSESGSIWVAVALTVSLYVVNDFMRWWLHYLQHKIPVLWEFHKIHHSAEHLNFATAERHHPLDAVFFLTGTISAAALVNGVFVGLFGDQLTVYQLGGANVIFFGSNLIGGVLRHSPAWVSYGPRIEKWLISPAMHQIHHSSDPKHWDKNMGGGLAIWDRMGGTLYVPKGREELDFGIGEETQDYRTVYGIYIEPLIKAKRIFQRS